MITHHLSWDGTSGSGQPGQGGTGASSGNPGGGGGGGYYGGAGGASGQGGGSSGFATSWATDVMLRSGVRSGSGLVTITYTPPPDTTPPSAGPTQSPAADAAGWNNTDVTVNWNWQDNAGGAGIDPDNCTASSTSSGEGTLTLSASCQDLAVNKATTSYTVKVDQTAPAITAAATTQPNDDGWYEADVIVHFTCTDALSGIPAGACPADQVLGAEGGAVSSAAETVADAAGNTSAPSNVVTVAIDKTPPVVAVTGVTDGAADTLGAVPTPGCTTSDALSGVATPATLIVSGGNADGTGTFTATCAGAMDNASNTAHASAIYRVGYAFSGYLGPVKNPPTVNSGHAGRTYPVKFQLTTASGAAISSLAAVQAITYQATGCAAFASAPSDALGTTATGGTSLRYDSGANQYVYNWQTPSTAGCYTLFLTLDSGQTFPADFALQ